MPSPSARTSGSASSPPRRRPCTRSRTTRRPPCASPSAAPSTAKASCCAADKLSMGAIATPLDAAATLAPDGEHVEARQTGGVTTRLILDYVEREGGREAVDRLLRSRGLESREPDLRAEDNWCSYATKIGMLEAAAKVLDDPLAARHIGEAGMD